MFRIDLSPLEPGVHRITREVDADALEPQAEQPSNEEGEEEGPSPEDASEAPTPVTEDVTLGPVQVDAVLDYEPGHALVTFQARTTATLTCDRTLQRFDQPIEGSYAVLFAAPDRSAPEESEEHDELRPFPPGARYLDLTDAVRDTLLLAIPQRKVAPGAEEEEIETVFGAPEPSEEDPVDPRWEKLRQLRSNDDD